MFETLLAAIARALEERQIPYMVVGGQAVLLHGEPRLTRDIDITLGLDVDRLPTVLDASAAAGLVPLVDPGAFTPRTLVLPCAHHETGIRVDFIFSFSPYEREAIQRATTVTLGGTPVRFASVEDLVIHKMVAGRPRDLEDVRSVLVKNPKLDRKRVRSVLRDFQASLGEPYVERFEAIVRDAG